MMANCDCVGNWMRVLLPRIYLAASLLEMASNLLAYLGLSIHPFSFRSQFCFSGSLDFALVLSLWSFLQRSSKVSDPIISQLTFKLPVALHPRIHLCHPFQSSAGYHFLEKHHKSPCSLSIQTNISVLRCVESSRLMNFWKFLGMEPSVFCHKGHRLW